MTTLQFSLHPAQQAIYNSTSRFKVVAAGRRFGKTILAVVMCIVAALEEENAEGMPLRSDAEVVYIGTTLEQARRNAWHLFKEYARPVAQSIHENTAVITLVNGVRIRLLGMDNPDAARGMKLRFAVLDEYADMPENVWMEIIRPALMDTKGGALFIGTPKGRNHFFELYKDGLPGHEDSKFPRWESFNFTSRDNTTLDADELDEVAQEYARGSSDLHAQEIEAQFVSKGGRIFSADQFPVRDSEPTQGSYYVAVDLAGFTTETGKRNSELKKRDETAIAVVKVFPVVEDGLTGTGLAYGWWVKQILHGQWDVRETAHKIVKAAVDVHAVAVGIEKGALMNAALPYIDEYQKEYNKWLNIQPLTHGNKHKWDRIQWALQGRAEKGRLFLAPGHWNDALIDQACEFPSRLVHDDLIDALAYIDQLVESFQFNWDEYMEGEFVPQDAIAGY